jgi:hypothetical protein
MNPSVESLIKRIPVDNSTRLEDYLKLAQNLRSQAKAQHDKQFYLDVTQS